MESQDTNTNQNAQALALLRIRKPASAAVSCRAAELLARREMPEPDQLLRLTVLDPLLAVWVLKRANSSYYGLRSTVDSLSRAIDVLGADSVAGMFAESESDEATAESPVSEAGVQTGVATGADSLTRHAVATAILAARMDSADARPGGFAFTAGLLHDIGKSVFALNYPTEASKMYSASSLWDSLQEADLVSVEQLAFGLDHREVGEYVARKMQFPENLTDVLQHHAAPASLPASHPVHRMAWIVNTASFAATALGYAAGNSVSWEMCRQDRRWDRLVREELTPWDTPEKLRSVCERSVEAIEELLKLDADSHRPLMNPPNRTNRVNRDPVGTDRSHDRTHDRTQGNRGESVEP